jgi:hypothetical protein
MTIHIDEGKNDIVFPSTTVVKLSTYNQYLEIVYKFNSDMSFNVYDPNVPEFNEFTTLNFGLSYQIYALQPFDIIA